ncbi:MAG: hypothetical protein HY909_22465 [Deltaproteobacteria bacterium]|nr:hypothetical protein [Deltaproteobacteria bacterium]
MKLRFGPLEASWDAPTPSWLAPFVGEGAPSSPAPWPTESDPRALQRALERWVLREAPALGCALVHAAAVSVEGGLGLLCGPPGVGKSTAARRAGPRFLADNAVLVCPESRTGWALPLAGGEGPPEGLDPEGRPVRVLAWLQRAPVPVVEWLRGPPATSLVARACVRPGGPDPSAASRAMITLQFASVVPVCLLGIPDGPGYLPALDEALGLEKHP